MPPPPMFVASHSPGGKKEKKSANDYYVILYVFSPLNVDGQINAHYALLSHPAPTTLGDFCNKKPNLSEC